MRIKVLIKRILLYILLLLAAFLCQTCIFPQISFLSSYPNLLLFIVFSYGLMYGSVAGMICGITAGLLLDLFYSGPFGFFILVFTYIGFFSGLLSNYFHDDSLTLPLVLCFFSELFYCSFMMIYRYFTTSYLDVSFSLRYVVLPETLFTLLLTLIFYRLVLNISKNMDKKDNLRGANLA